MQHRGGAVTVRLLVVLAASMVAVWILAGGELTVHHSMSGAGVALAAAAVTPALLTADRHDASPSLKSLAAQAGRSASRSGATSPSRMAQPLGRRPF
jgi:hypothetical protein